MRVMLATICLNEMEWLPKLVEQHRDWPGLCGWVFVEGVDPAYARRNPDLVSPFGMSVDGTTEFLLDLAHPPFYYVSQGCSTGGETYPEDQYKCLLRNCYLRVAHHIKPDIIVVLDADEFYTKQDQQRINDITESFLESQGFLTSQTKAWMFKQRHIWNPEYGRELRPLFSQEVVGGYWQVPHTRVWRYVPGMRYVRNHNWPEVDGQFLTAPMVRADLFPNQEILPQCVHMGYASSSKYRLAKHRYYVERGEGQEGGRLGRKRNMYVSCREAHLTYQPGDVLPGGADVVTYNGPIPEVFR